MTSAIQILLKLATERIRRAQNHHKAVERELQEAHGNLRAINSLLGTNHHSTPTPEKPRPAKKPRPKPPKDGLPTVPELKSQAQELNVDINDLFPPGFRGGPKGRWIRNPQLESSLKGKRTPCHSL